MVSVRTTDMKIIGLSKTVKVKGNSAVQRSPQNTAQQRRQPDLTTVLFNEGDLLAKSLLLWRSVPARQAGYAAALA